MTFTGKLSAWLGWDWRDGATDSGRLEFGQDIADGDGTNQAEVAWHETDATLSSGTSQTLDLTALSRTILGASHSVTLTSVRAILIVSSATSAGTLLVGGAASDTWDAPFGAADDTVRVAPGSPLILASLASGWPVDASNKNLKLTASGGAVTYSIALIGT